MEVLRDGRVRFRATDGRVLQCRVPMHVSLAWLRAALIVAPVQAEVTVTIGVGQPSLWALFPGPEHADVRAEHVELAASERVDLVCGNSRVSLRPRDLSVRSRDVLVSGARATRVRGSTVKLN